METWSEAANRAPTGHRVRNRVAVDRPSGKAPRLRDNGVYLVTPDGGTEGVTAKHAEIDLENMRLHCWPANTSPEHGSFIVELEEGRELGHYVRGRVVWVGHELV